MRRGCNGEASVHPPAFHPLLKSLSGTTTVLIVLGKAALSSGEVSNRARSLLSPGLLQALGSARGGGYRGQAGMIDPMVCLFTYTSRLSLWGCQQCAGRRSQTSYDAGVECVLQAQLGHGPLSLALK